MNINVISLFPEIIESSLRGLTGKAFTNNHAQLNLINLKEFQQIPMEVLMTHHMVEARNVNWN